MRQLRCKGGRANVNEVFREERKYFITLMDLMKLSGMLEQVMLQDSHNGAWGYRIRSLYFDTPYEKDYTDKIEGLELRRKIRLRNYDPAAGFAMLEMKQKQNFTDRLICHFEDGLRS